MPSSSAGGGNPTLLVDRDMQDPELHPFVAGTAAAYSARCPGKEVNEDGAVLIPFDDDSGVLAVADGLGGQPAGDRAARLALEQLSAALARARRAGTLLRAAILDGFEHANREIQSLRLGAGTTLAAVELRRRTARTYHVGDSEVLIVGQRGKMRLQTVSHSPVAYGVEAGLLDERAAMRHEDRHLLSNLVGSPEMRIEIGPVVKLRQRDTVLVASDGLFDNLRTDEIVEMIRRGKLAPATARLAERCRSRMRGSGEGRPAKPDDLTFVVYRPDSEGFSRTTPAAR